MLLTVALMTGTAAAQTPTGGGRITLFPGYRLGLQNSFYRTAALAGFTRAPGAMGGPALWGTFAYTATQYVEVAIEPFLGTEVLHLAEVPPIRMYTYGVTIGARAQYPTESGVTPS